MFTGLKIIIEKINRNQTRVLFVTIIITTLFLRLFKLGNIPNGFANDEAAVAYQSYSILITGKDTWGKPFPLLSFKDFGEYLPPFAVYSIAPFIKLLGLTIFATRLPFALTAVIAIFPIYALTKELFKNKKIALLACFLFAVSPFNIGWSRFVFEGNFGMLFYLLGITFLILAKRRSHFLPFSALFFGLTFTTYHIYYFLTPVTVVVLSAPSIAKFVKSKKSFVIATIVSFIFVIYALAIVASGSGRERFRQVSIFQNQNSLINLNSRQSYCQKNLPLIFCRIFFNKGETYLYDYSFNYFSHLSPTFLALDGTYLRQAILPKHGLIYPFELPFILIGLFFLVKNFTYTSYTLISLILIYPLANSFTGVGEISRISQIMPIFPILSAYGIFISVSKIKKIFRPLLITFLVGFALSNIIAFLLNYFFVFPKTNGYFDSEAYVKLFQKIRLNPRQYSNYYITRDYKGSAPEYQARIFLPISPLAFQNPQRNEYAIKKPQNYVDYTRLDNYHFFNGLLDISPGPDDLVVLNYDQLNLAKKIEFTVFEANGQPALIAVKGSQVIYKK